MKTRFGPRRGTSFEGRRRYGVKTRFGPRRGTSFEGRRHRRRHSRKCERLFILGHETQIVEQRQQLGQHHRHAPPVHAEAPHGGVGVGLGVERRGEPARPFEDLGDAAQVGDRTLRRDGGPVRRRGARPQPLEQTATGPFAELGDRGGEQPVVPRRRLRIDRALQLVEVGTGGHRRAPHADRHACERAGADEGLERALARRRMRRPRCRPAVPAARR